MPPSKPGRSYYYLDGDHSLVRRFVTRPQGTRPSRRKTDADGQLVVAFDYDGVKLQTAMKGPRFSEHWWRLAFLQEFDIRPSTGDDLGSLIPADVRSVLTQTLRALADEAHRMVVRNWNNVGKENDLVGILVSVFNQEAIPVGDWSIEIRPQVFSDQAKEPHVGADLGWIVQIRIGNHRRTTKALWMQAKKTAWDIPSSKALLDLPDFERQYKTMKRWTDEAYGLVFTQDKLIVGNDAELTDLDRLLDDAVACRRGDQRPAVLAQTVDRYLVTIDLHAKRARQAQARRAHPPRRLHRDAGATDDTGG